MQITIQIPTAKELKDSVARAARRTADAVCDATVKTVDMAPRVNVSVEVPAETRDEVRRIRENAERRVSKVRTKAKELRSGPVVARREIKREHREQRRLLRDLAAD